MLLLSWSTIRDRWPLFVGALLTVTLAVALTQASLLSLVSAATADVPAGLSEVDELALRAGYAGAVSLLGIVVGIAFLVSILIVSSTFAFAVAQRRREIALLRLVGAERRQVRRLLLGEALLLGLAGTALGIPLGLLVAGLQDGMLSRLDLVPDGFETEWRPWIVAVSAGVGAVVASLAAWSAARRAGRVRPLEALRGSVRTDRVMTPGRWIVGLVALGGTIAMIAAAPFAGPEGGVALSINVCLVGVLGLSAWAPVIVPAVARLITAAARVLAPRSPMRDLVGGNVRVGVRRISSTSTPIIVLAGLVVGLGGALAVMEAGLRQEATSVNTSDVLAVSDRSLAGALAGLDGVEVVSEEVEAVAHVLAAEDPEDELRDTAVPATMIDPPAYLATHAVDPERGDLAALTGRSIAVDGDLAARMRVDVGDTAPVRVGDRWFEVEVVAVMPLAFSATSEAWLPDDLVADAPEGSTGDHRVAVVTTGPGAATDVISVLTAAGADARPTSDAVGALLDDAERRNRSIQIALLGLSALFTLIAIVNSVVIATADRREELATLRLSGFTHGQVVRMGLWESAVVVLTGTLLGTLAATGSVIGMSNVVGDIVGERVVAVPWQVWVSTASVVAFVVAIASVLTTRAALHRRPIAVVGARE